MLLPPVNRPGGLHQAVNRRARTMLLPDNLAFRLPAFELLYRTNPQDRRGRQV